MSHKKRKTTCNKDVLKSLSKLNFPVINYQGIPVSIKLNATSRSRDKQIAKQYHGLKSSDIEQIPNILANPTYVVNDPKHKEKKNYYGRRAKSKKILFVKIVTKKIYSSGEEIITLFTTNKIKR